ncbi:MAG: dihydroorotase, partial [Chitinophagales bacterium]|nr:dihydroorotase [Chitinophagales bacterium]
ADAVLVDLKKEYTVLGQPSPKANVLYKCGWSPLEGKTFTGQVITTFVNGYPVYKNQVFDERQMGMRLEFDRPN